MVGIILHIILASMNAILLPVMMYIGYKVVKLTKCSNYKLVVFIIMINICIISNLVLRIYISHDALMILNDATYTRNLPVFWILYLGDQLLFMLTILSNANIWAFHAIKIRQIH